MIIDFDSEKPIIFDSLSKMSQMTKMLYPVKKAY